MPPTVPSLTITTFVNSLAFAVAVKRMETVTSPLASWSQAEGGRILTSFLLAEFIHFIPLVLCWLSFQSFLIKFSGHQIKIQQILQIL